MIELYAGLHGWGEGALSEGFWVVGFDIVDMCAELGLARPKGIDLVIQDVLTLHGSQFKDAAVIVASPPCQAYSYRAMPWSRAKALPPPDNTLFEACFRIQREASEAAGRYIPLIVENVRGAQKWVGKAAWHFGSYFLWGDVPALMPVAIAQKFNPDGTDHAKGSWFAIADSMNRGSRSVKLPANNSADRWEDRPIQRLKDAPTGTPPRKAASAMIAKIPFPLSQHIARCYAERILEVAQ